MKMLNMTALAASVALLVGCTTNPYTGEQQAGKAGVYGGIGAVSGAVIGAATSSKKDRTKGALIGAAVRFFLTQYRLNTDRKSVV